MTTVYIFGSGGFAKEVEWMRRQIPLAGSGSYSERKTFFVTENGSSEKVNEIEVISERDFFSKEDPYGCECYIGIGEPKIREKVYQKIVNSSKSSEVSFPTLIHKNVEFDEKTVKIGEGSIICDGAKITVNTNIGKFTIINNNATIGHDCNIKDFVTISPGVNICGNVKLNNKVYFGVNSSIIENKEICEQAFLGASCTVTKSITEPGVYVGTPARKIK